MKKDEAERAIRYLCGKWRKEEGISQSPDGSQSYLEFKSWARLKGYDHYFEFRSVRGADADAELWFDEEFRQVWRY